MTAHKIILYDDHCPLCCWYTGAFVKTGLLPQNGRQAFTELDPSKLNCKLNIERSKDEIPLLDTQGGPTLYGIDSLLYILGERWPWMERVVRWSPVNWFLHRLYKFISYNRRVIVASETPAGSFDCSPQFNVGYRLLYLAFACLLGLSTITYSLQASGFANRAWMISLGLLLLVASPALSLEDYRTRLNYLGIMLTPFLVLGLLFMVSTAVALPLWLGGGVAILIAARMWSRRWRVATRGM